MSTMRLDHVMHMKGFTRVTARSSLIRDDCKLGSLYSSENIHLLNCIFQIWTFSQSDEYHYTKLCISSKRILRNYKSFRLILLPMYVNPPDANVLPILAWIR